MNIRLVDVDGHSGFPNLALMKLSAWHKAQGDNVDWYQPLFDDPDRIYASKVFICFIGALLLAPVLILYRFGKGIYGLFRKVGA